MTLDEAIEAVEATVDPAQLRVDRKRAREDASSYLLIVLDVSAGRGEGPVANGPRLVDKRSGQAPCRSRRELASGGGRGSFQTGASSDSSR